MIPDLPINLVTSAGGSGELGQAVRPCGAAGCPGAQQQQGTVLPSVGAGSTCPRASRGPWHARLMKALLKTHISEKTALVI